LAAVTAGGAAMLHASTTADAAAGAGGFALVMALAFQRSVREYFRDWVRGVRSHDPLSKDAELGDLAADSQRAYATLGQALPSDADYDLRRSVYELAQLDTAMRAAAVIGEQLAIHESALQHGVRLSAVQRHFEADGDRRPGEGYPTLARYIRSYRSAIPGYLASLREIEGSASVSVIAELAGQLGQRLEAFDVELASQLARTEARYEHATGHENFGADDPQIEQLRLDAAGFGGAFEAAIGQARAAGSPGTMEPAAGSWDWLEAQPPEVPVALDRANRLYDLGSQWQFAQLKVIGRIEALIKQKVWEGRPEEQLQCLRTLQESQALVMQVESHPFSPECSDLASDLKLRLADLSSRLDPGASV
jgi:hypothetical protein